MSGTFRALGGFNYRVWAMGALVSNVGTWMQRTAQDWIVLTALTRHNATAVGVVMALQFGPQLVLLPWTGLAADRFDRRRLLMVTQSAMGLLALGLGLLDVTGLIRLWQVYGFALALGCVSAFDLPARQTFVGELVDRDLLSNAVALNSASFNVARAIGPAIAGVLIASVGAGCVFLLNAASYVGVLASLCLLRTAGLTGSPRAARTPSGFADGLRYVATRPDLVTVLLMLFLIGTFGLNFTIFISTMSVGVFHAGARGYGLLTSAMAIGSVTGTLVAAGRADPDLSRLLVSAGCFGCACLAAAFMPDLWLFGAVLALVGIAAQTFTTATSSLVQLSTEPAMRGRVVAILLAVAVGGTPVGAPIVGWVADRFGPRWSLGVGAAGGLLACLVALRHILRHGRMALVPTGARPAG